MSVSERLEEELKGRTITAINLESNGEGLTLQFADGGQLVIVKGICEHDPLKVVVHEEAKAA